MASGAAAVRSQQQQQQKKGAVLSTQEADDEFFAQVLVAWLKDTREVARRDVVKRFRELFEKGVSEREFVLRSQRLGVNTALVIAQNLVRLPHFQKLDLYENLVRDAGCEALAGLVRESGTLTYLNLGGNDIGPAGAAHLAAVIAPQQARNLHTLILGSADADMHANRIDAASGRALAEALRRSRTIRHVDLNRNPLGKGDQSAFEGFAGLIDRNAQLKTLRLGCTMMSTDSGQYLVSKLSHNSALEELDLHNNDLGYQVAETLAKVLREKRSRGARSSLTRLLLHQNPRIGERGAAPLFLALADSPLALVDVSDCGVNDEAAMRLAEALGSARTLTHLNLSRNYITHVGVISLAKALQDHPSLRFLSLSQNKARCEGAVALAATLELNQVLQTLCLEEAWIGDEGCIAIGVALAANNSLGVLRLTGNHISDEAGRAFATLMGRNRSIHSINIRGNQVDHSTVLRLKRTLKRNKEIKENEEPSRLQKEVIRLHYQQCKLHEATLELQKNKQARERIQADENRLDEQLGQEQAEFAKKTKELRDRIALDEAAMKENEAKRGAREGEFEKFRQDCQDEIERLKLRLEEEAAKRQEAEQELERRRRELEDLKAGRDQKIRAIQRETQEKRDNAEAARKQIMIQQEKLVEKEEVLKLLREKEEEKNKERERKAAEQRAVKARKAEAAEAKRREQQAAEQLLMSM